MSKLDMIKEKFDVAEDAARKIWLAGLGAYGKSIDSVQGQVEKVNADSNRVFNELVAKGEELEGQAKDKIKEKTAVDQRVADVRKKLGLDKTEDTNKIEALSQKIDDLTDIVAKLAK
ncbi:MAG: putative nucleic acid-binding Zn-ribbon protein [Alteromonadaceae bacterium]|jgi:predicted  nucleic acid-binding Zn-ribbon protein